MPNQLVRIHPDDKQRIAPAGERLSRLKGVRRMGQPDIIGYALMVLQCMREDDLKDLLSKRALV